MFRAPLSLCVIACAAIAFSTIASFAQDQPKKPAAEEKIAEKIPDSAPELSYADVPEEQTTAERVNGQINSVFEPGVEMAASVLMRPVYWTTQKYVQFDHVVHYTRPIEEPELPFTIYQPDVAEKPVNFPDSLTLAEADTWKARGKLLSGNSKQPFSLGKLGGKSVEVVAIKVDTTTKYVQQTLADGKVVYKEAGDIRGLLSQDVADWKTPEQIQEMADRHLLKLGGEAGEPPYILTEKVGNAPLVVVWLAGGALFFTIYFGFVNFWGFRHSIEVVSGAYDDPDEPGEVTHFQALASALSATVGLGNIAGVTIAMTTGGPGAFFWMMLCGFLGMASKFAECTLGQMYREVKPDGTILGGPMQYLLRGFEEIGLKPVGIVFSVVFAVLCIMASFGGGNMFQSNQSADAAVQLIQGAKQDKISDLAIEISAAEKAEDWTKLAELQEQKAALQTELNLFAQNFKMGFGVVFAILVALVIIGGIKRIAAVSSKIVPIMCISYVLMCIYVILMHIGEVPHLFQSIFTEAFTPKAALGGIIGVAIIGIQRAAFSNEAGVGSAAIAHSAAKTDQPIREGLVALLGPFIDTIVVCSMTAMVILITNAWDNKDWVVDQGLKGAALTSQAFEKEVWWFSYILSISILLFAYSTIISWSYYGERCWERLFGAGSTMVYKVLYVGFVFIGAVANLGAVIDFSDMMLLSMAFPNIVGVILLSPKVRRHLFEYWRKYKAGEFKKFK
ncbi:alanine:cation symporter family protein [Blastopirellula sp. JC732]|uniref:Alanine:cation symporter family protein n=1 Tax=Blastopirellula sediminis TaxID=2894196 RepID=A0A9X1MT04_9BACT|nr:alanine/glycine:cation symporter family protein [Blastopirellula sediminis]MCC9604480.1 alanine:cation symporter family protein [Blastopirellula sediminis]MCC9632221.1 alanine:cation symporter family protein [Blastopirellula sediminis]